MIKPHGGRLINRLVSEERRRKIEKKVSNICSLKIEDRYVSDCEMVAIGGFSPLTGFMDKKTVKSILDKMQLPNGLIWAIPIVLPINDSLSKNIKAGDEISLYDKSNNLIAIMAATEIFKLDKDDFCKKIFKTIEIAHPGVRALKESGDTFLAGDIELVNRPVRENIDKAYFLDPAQTRGEFEKRGLKTIVAFQTRNPIHRAHEYLIKCAMESLDGALIHPIVGETKPDDIPANVRMKCYEILIEKYFNKDRIMLSVLPMAMRYAGPREAVHHLIVRKNYGCTHIIIGRDHAGVGDYYGTYEAQELVDSLGDSLEIKPIKFEHSFYCKICENMASSKTCPHKAEDHIHLSGTKVRAMLKEGNRPPKEFSRREVADVLSKWTSENK